MFGRLIFNNEMTQFLSICNVRKIADSLLYGREERINEEGNFIKQDCSQNQIDFISYLPCSKYQKANDIDPFSKGLGRIKIRIGRFIRKFLKSDTLQKLNITDKDIEEFVNQFKSYFNNSIDVIKVVSGKEILHWYLEENYYTPSGKRLGSLWNSCMRYKERNKYMKIYSENTSIKMAVYIVDNTVRARALLWDDVMDSNGDNLKVMDRIYSVFDHDVHLFKKWASENGYLPKFYQNAKSEGLFDLGGVPVKKDIILKLNKWNFSTYPYLDTFKYFDYRLGKLSNSSKFDYDYILIQSNGDVEPQPEPDPEPDWDEN